MYEKILKYKTPGWGLDQFVQWAGSQTQLTPLSLSSLRRPTTDAAGRWNCLRLPTHNLMLQVKIHTETGVGARHRETHFKNIDYAKKGDGQSSISNLSYTNETISKMATWTVSSYFLFGLPLLVNLVFVTPMIPTNFVACKQNLSKKAHNAAQNAENARMETRDSLGQWQNICSLEPNDKSSKSSICFIPHPASVWLWK